MTYFQSFDSLDDMLAEMKRQEDAARARITNIQRQVEWGSHWKMHVPEWDITIYGRVLTREEAWEQSRTAGATEAELETEDMGLLDAYERGYRFGYAYSAACPEGELGSTHISEMVGPITRDEFEQARQDGWE